MHYMHCFVEELESLLYLILCCESVSLEGYGLQPKTTGAVKEDSFEKWQW